MEGQEEEARKEREEQKHPPVEKEWDGLSARKKSGVPFVYLLLVLNRRLWDRKVTLEAQLEEVKSA